MEKTLGQVGFEAYEQKHPSNKFELTWEEASPERQEAEEAGAQAVKAELIRRGIVIKPPEPKPERTKGQRLYFMLHPDGQWNGLAESTKKRHEETASKITFPPEPEPGEVLRKIQIEYYSAVDTGAWKILDEKTKAFYNVLARNSNLDAIRNELEALKAKEGK